MSDDNTIEIAVADIVYREDLYPRIKADPAIIQRYAENLELLPPVEVNQHNILIDGFHRWTAHRKAGSTTLRATVTTTASEVELYALAIKRNANHGLQLSEADKKSDARRLYNSGNGLTKEQIADALSVTLRTVNSYLQDVDRQLNEERDARIFDLWLACYSQEEIAESLSLSQDTVKRKIATFNDLGSLSKIVKTLAFFDDADFQPPIYNIWPFAKKSNEVTHFGNSEQRILDNLLYLYTEPFDIVVDPFAGGGATIDICKKRLRRYWCSDRKPIIERENEIRMLDLTAEMPPLNKRWADVTLTYLDPPYWKQAEGEYSSDPEDLANMPLAQFTDTLSGIIKQLSQKQSRGVIAILMQPTQWRADNRQFTDHVFDIVQAVGNKRMRLENRVSCPYSTEQCTPQMVNWAKENKQLLVLTRELVIWRLI